MIGATFRTKITGKSQHEGSTDRTASAKGSLNIVLKYSLREQKNALWHKNRCPSTSKITSANGARAAEKTGAHYFRPIADTVEIQT